MCVLRPPLLLVLLAACTDPIPAECHKHDDAWGRAAQPGSATGLGVGERRGVTIRATEPQNHTGLRLDEGSYRLTTLEGRVCDERYPSGADGIASPNPVLSASEHLRVQPDADWMELVADVGGERTIIGQGPTTLTVTAGDELLLFVNDVAGFYGNNHGGFVVLVERTR